MNPVDRVGLLLGRDPRLGTVLDRLAGVYRGRRLVEQHGDARLGVGALQLSYRQAADRVARWSDAIAEDIEPGDRVVVATPNGYGFLLLCLAASRAGGVPVPVNPQMRPTEVDHVIDDSGATLVIRDEADLAPATGRPGPPRQGPGEVAAIFYTSGTTGRPKGVRLTHEALAGQVRGLGLPGPMHHREAVVGLPVAHIYGFLALLGLASLGVPTYFLPRFHADEALDAIERRRASMFLGVPAMYRLLLEAGAEDRDLTSVRVWASGADAMPKDLAQRFQRMGAAVELPLVGPVGEALFAEGYGMVELGGAAAGRISLPGVDRLLGDAVGLPRPGFRMKVVDGEGREVRQGQTGELLVKGPGMLEGYHNAPEATAALITADGWLRTGDLARRGPFGTVTFAGRQKDVIKHGGYSVYALEVEQVLQEHPAVAEAAVVGVPDERSGQLVAAAVRLMPGSTLTEPELVAFARDRLAAYKAPVMVRVVDDFPRTGTEKVQKRELLPLFTDA